MVVRELGRLAESSPLGLISFRQAARQLDSVRKVEGESLLGVGAEELSVEPATALVLIETQFHPLVEELVELAESLLLGTP